MAGTRVRLGVLGGTFDPIHRVHLLMARAVIRALGLDRVLFVPTGTPSHRDPATVSPTADRCAMVAAALDDEPRFRLSTVDALRPGPTYTCDTLRDLRSIYGPAAELHLIIGADNLAWVRDWRDSAEIVRSAHIVGTSRFGHRLIDPGLPAGRLTLLPIPSLDISSTMIRRLVAERRPVHHLTRPAVARYIRDNGLYLTKSIRKTSTYAVAEPPAEWEAGQRIS